MVLDVSDHLGKLLDIGRFQVDQVISKNVVLDAPEVHSEVVCREEVLSVGRRAHRVDIVVVTVLVLFALNAFITLLHDLAGGQFYLAVWAD